MREVAVAGDDKCVHDARQERRVRMKNGNAKKNTGRDRKYHQFSRSADAVDREAAQPFLQIVAVGAKDEVFVAEERDGDGNGLRGDRSDIGNERLASMRQQMAEQNNAAGVKSQRDDRIRHADYQEANDLACG